MFTLWKLSLRPFKNKHAFKATWHQGFAPSKGNLIASNNEKLAGYEKECALKEYFADFCDLFQIPL